MTYEEYNRSVDAVIADLQGGAHGLIMVKVALNSLALIKKRVQETGTDAEGQKYGAYSRKPILIGCSTFIQKSACEALLGSKPKRKKLEWRTIGSGPTAKRLAILPGGYAEVRTRQGRQVNHVDFSVTNDMWNDINIRSTSSDHINGKAVLGARLEKEKKKLAGNTERKGEILNLSDSEIETIKRVYNAEVLEIFRKNGL